MKNQNIQKKSNPKIYHELKIRFKTVRGVKVLEQFKSYVRKEKEGSINQIAEDLMIPEMQNYIAHKTGIQDMISEQIRDSMDKQNKSINKAMDKKLQKLTSQLQINTLPLDTKMNLLLNLLADKDVIDATKLDDPSTDMITDLLFSKRMKDTLANELVNKEKDDD